MGGRSIEGRNFLFLHPSEYGAQQQKWQKKLSFCLVEGTKKISGTKEREKLYTTKYNYFIVVISNDKCSCF